MAVFKQRRWGHRVSVELGDADLRYSSTDGGMRFSFRVPYDAFDIAQFVRQDAPAAKPGSVIVFCAILSTAMLFAWHRPAASIIIVNAIVIGLLGAALYAWRFTRLFSIPFYVYGNETDGEAFRLIGDGQFDEIVATITALRRDRLRQLWAVPDLENDLAMERSRFDWLLAHDIIDADEHAEATRSILARASGDETPKRLH